MNGRDLRSSTKLICVLSALLLAIISPVQSQEQSLYKRVGGYDVLAAIAADFTKQLGRDPILKPYFFARSNDSRRRILQMFRELLCADAGGPCFYVGRDMKTAHTGLKLGETEWEAVMKLWGETLDSHKLAGREKTEMIQIFAKYKGEILSAATAK